MYSDKLIDDAPWVPATSLAHDLAVTSMKILLPHCSPETVIDPTLHQHAARSRKVKDIAGLEQTESETDSDPNGHASESSADENWSSNLFESPSTALRAPEEETCVVDIDPEEGRRRGAELMGMLMLEEQPPSHARAFGKPVATSLDASAPVFVPSWSAERQPAVDVHSATIIKAAHDAFGADLSEVEGDAEDGFTVRLSISGDGSRWEPNKALSRLTRCLWPLLGPDTVGLVPTVIPRRAWLSLHIMPLPEMERMRAYCCWDFGRYGMCPRGKKCRWPHTQAKLKIIDIEVSY
mmetsp:Transcript_45124/g.81475  ORF Transcript_45124/g.81475 Transcript_45124/m.81475 type:complete len:294 (+) Transcript_45124:87-968(+)